MKDANGLVLTDGMKIQERWKEYFESLLNEENLRDYQDDGIPYPGLTSCVERAVVVRTLQKMKNKTTGPDEILVETWGVLGEANEN